MMRIIKKGNGDKMKAKCKQCGEEIELDNCELEIDDDGWIIKCPNGCIIICGEWVTVL